MALGGSAETLRHTMEASSLLQTVLSLLGSVGELERAWAVAGERSAADVTVLEARLAEARGEAAARGDEASRLRAALKAAEADADAARGDVARAVADGDIRAARAAEARSGEIDAWKVSYAEEMRRFGEARAAEAAHAARTAAEEVADAALRSLDSEARAALAVSSAHAESAVHEAAANARAAAAAEKRAMDAEARAASFADAAARAEAESDAAKRESSEARNAAASLADELLRTRHLLSLERATSDEVARLNAVSAAAEASAAEAMRITTLEAEASKHSSDIESLRSGFDAAIRARDDSVAEWRSRYAAAAARAEQAEALVKAIDRQLAPHAALAAVPGASLSNPSLLARSWAAASGAAFAAATSPATSSSFGATSIGAATMRSPPAHEPRNTPWSNATLRAIASGSERASEHSPIKANSPTHDAIYSDRMSAASRLKSAQSHAVAAATAVSTAASMIGTPRTP